MLPSLIPSSNPLDQTFKLGSLKLGLSKITRCRMCSSLFEGLELVVFEGMPKSAQHLPEEGDLTSDDGVDLELVQCPACGLVQTTNQPVHYFREVIRASGISSEMIDYRRGQFRGFMKEYGLFGKSLVEFGCGSGEYLQILSELNSQCYGVEYGESSLREAREKDLSVLPGYFENGTEKIPEGPFDGFLFLNFLEHIPNPRTVLAGLRNNLVEQGVGIVEVPNFDMIIRESLFSEFVTDHLFYFSAETLVASLMMNGFEVLRCEETWHNYTLTATVKKRPTFITTGVDSFCLQLRKSFNHLIDQYPQNGVAIWGAGHQAFTILALAKLEGRIRYVVDSAPFKQGKFTPATHIPIVSPEVFYEDDLLAIVVVAGSYTQEVISAIQSHMSRDIDIFTVSGSNLTPS